MNGLFVYQNLRCPYASLVDYAKPTKTESRNNAVPAAFICKIKKKISLNVSDPSPSWKQFSKVKKKVTKEATLKIITKRLVFFLKNY